MNMLKNFRFLTLILLIVFASCEKKVTVDFNIINETTFKVDSLYIEPNQNRKNKIINIGQNEEVDYQIDMSHVEKIDGLYQIFYKLNDEKKYRNFGYYTNGYPLGYPFKLNIKNDTIIVQEIHENY